MSFGKHAYQDKAFWLEEFNVNVMEDAYICTEIVRMCPGTNNPQLAPAVEIQIKDDIKENILPLRQCDLYV